MSCSSRLRGGLGGPRKSALPALLLRLGANARRAGEARRRIHAGCIARRRPRRRPRPRPRARARGRLRAPRAARPRLPEAVDGAQLLLDLRDRFGITLAPGQGELKGKVFRIGHIGYFDVFDITTALAGIEVSLAEAGADVERGVAVTRALETYERTPA